MDITPEAVAEAGRIKIKLGLSLADSMVIGAAVLLGGRAVFRKRERRMGGLEENLSWLGVVFLEDLEVP